MFSGVRCAICGMALESPDYQKDERGEGLYWMNPKISEYTDVVVDFCGPIHSLEWWQKAKAASEGVAVHDNDPEQSQPTP